MRLLNYELGTSAHFSVRVKHGKKYAVKKSRCTSHVAVDSENIEEVDTIPYHFTTIILYTNPKHIIVFIPCF